MLRNYLNYAGSKDRYYPLIRDFLERAVEGLEKPSLVDMFCGSGVVSFNSLDLFNTVGAFDGCKELIKIHEWALSDRDVIGEIRDIINRYALSKSNKEGFLQLRENYNKRVVDEGIIAPAELYCLITHSFNYSLHLNKKGEFNAPSGAGRSYFSASLENKLLQVREYVHKYDKDHLLFINQGLQGWRGFITTTVSAGIGLSNTVFFVDPPYSASVSKHPYRVGQLKWGDEEDRELFKILDMIHSHKGKFVFTNVFHNNGVENRLLQGWSTKYKVFHVGVDYSNCNYQRFNKGDTDEVIIYNF